MDTVFVVINGNEIRAMTREEASMGRHLWFETREEAVAFILASSI